MNERRRWIIVLATITIFVTTAGFLPGLVRAGNLEPSAPLGSTMKTLDEVPPTWSQKLPASERFVLVLDGAGVLDKETGLVWEKSPDITVRDWFEACYYCYNKEVGGRKGWRLPTVEELTSLIDTTNTSPTLPTGHPFLNVQSSYWSSSTLAGHTSYAWYVGLDSGHVYSMVKDGIHCVWCARGGYGHDAY